MSAHRTAAASAYDAAIAQLMGCRGLFTAPLTAPKLALLRQRLNAGGEYLATAYRLVSAAEAEAAYTPAPATGAPSLPPPAADTTILPFRSRAR